jgi:hypothetical protein
MYIYIYTFFELSGQKLIVYGQKLEIQGRFRNHK